MLVAKTNLLMALKLVLRVGIMHVHAIMDLYDEYEGSRWGLLVYAK